MSGTGTAPSLYRLEVILLEGDGKYKIFIFILYYFYQVLLENKAKGVSTRKNMNASKNLLSIPQSGGRNIKTFRWDHRNHLTDVREMYGLCTSNILYCTVL